ncbi:MAG TPA: helix-turn-helix domain-containing protein [Acetobacteraceae bacterium]|nr:helix-turn-helix domain-containing protein [Acetobacteraceae bacterium]
MPDTLNDPQSALPNSIAADAAGSGPRLERMSSPEPFERIAHSGEKMLSIARVAERFGRSPRTVRWWIATGRLPVVRIGRTPFVPVEALDRMVEEALNGNASEVNDINTGA